MQPGESERDYLPAQERAVVSSKSWKVMRVRVLRVTRRLVPTTRAMGNCPTDRATSGFLDE